MDKAAERIGKRIRAIRKYRGITQDSLASETGVTVDLIRKYEGGLRKPSSETMPKLAGALSVSENALLDPIPSDVTGVMYSLFEMAENFGVRIEEGNDCVSISFKSDEMNEQLRIWNRKRTELEARRTRFSTDEEKDEALKRYNDWKWNYSQNEISVAERRKEIEEQIKRLQGELDKLKE